PMTSLNPYLRVSRQIGEVLELHRGLMGDAIRARVLELLELVRIDEAETRLRSYPHQLSGGQRQRVMIAMALACQPEILIADEPTTALDVTIQAQILDLLRDLQRETGMAIVLITHDLGVVARMADEVLVMYAGQIVERGTVDDVFYRSAHPYTLGLRHAMPSNDPAGDHVLKPIDGSPPDLFHPPAGCGYFARCPHAMRVCENRDPGAFTIGERHSSRCWLHHESAPQRVSELYYPTPAPGPDPGPETLA
ncbi:MAG: ABC transporter ATP-binding protein, partial [Pseudomonadales bacterium]|nr:ABC transporter ATP-binding protein [Pseudomonadales bacterium]